MADAPGLGGILAVLMCPGARAAGQAAVAFDPGGAARLASGMRTVSTGGRGRAVAVTDMSVQNVPPGEDHATRVARMLGGRVAVVVGVARQRGPGLVDLVAVCAFEHARREARGCMV